MGTHPVKGNYTTTARGTFPYCKEHNRLFAHAVVGWLTPVYPDQLDTFPTICDVCNLEQERRLAVSSFRKI
jgi:hypothetical protein